jgi:hypothetical protein
MISTASSDRGAASRPFRTIASAFGKFASRNFGVKRLPRFTDAGSFEFIFFSFYETETPNND